MSPPPTLTVEYRDDVAIIVIDDPDEPVNTLGHELAAELTDILDALEQRQSLRGVVLISGKPNGFVAGADLDMLRAVRREADASALSKLSQSLSQRISDIRVPTVAAIHGPCLGGGLELALAFDLRVATDSEATRLGLPEVQLGLLPGGGGTQRLPRLVGVLAALDLLLTGRQIRGRRAVQIGLVDALVEPDGLLERALALVSNGGGRAHRPASSWFNRAGLAHVLLTSNPIGRRWLFQRVRGQTLAKTKGCYPAPEQIIEVVRIGLAQGESSGLEAEAIAFGRLAVSPQSRQLVNLFFAANEIKKDPGLEDTTVAPSELKRVGVLGGGLMGAGIAFIAAVRNELPVHIKDRDQRGVDGALARVQRLLDARVARGRMSADEKSAVLRRVTGSVDYAGFADLDIVIEAVFEELALKREMLQQVEAVGASSPDIRIEHLGHPNRRYREARRASRAGHRHALLLPGRADAVARDRSGRSHPPGGGGYLRAVRKAAGQDGGGGRRWPRLLHLTNPRSLPERGGLAAHRRGADRAHRLGITTCGISRRADPSTRRDRHRRR